MPGDVWFMSYLFFFLPDTDVGNIICDILFVALVIPFSYEDKLLAQH